MVIVTAATNASNGAEPGGAPKSATNVMWNWLGVIVETLAALVVTPLLIRGLGDRDYGIWIVIGALTSSLGMLDLGLRNAIGRYFALHHARNECDRLGEVYGTAIRLLSLLGGGAASVVVLAACATPLFLPVVASDMITIQAATAIVGLQLGAFFLSKLFDAALWGMQRFDLINFIDIPTTILRTALIAWLIVLEGGGLVALALISLGTVVLNGIGKYLLVRSVTQKQWMSQSRGSLEMRRELLGFGFWSFLISVAQGSRVRLGPALVGMILGVTAVTPLSVIMRLPSVASQFVIAAAGVLVPKSVAIHARNDISGRRHLLLTGTRNSLCLALYFLTLFSSLGGPLLGLWIRPEFSQYALHVLVLACGDVLPMAMLVARGTLTAMALQNRLAKPVFLETGCSLLFGGLCAAAFGLIGFVGAVAISATVFRGALILMLIVEVTGIPLREFVRCCFLRPLSCAVAINLMLNAYVMANPPDTWPSLVVHGAIFSLIFWLAIAFAVGGRAKLVGIGRAAHERFVEMRT